MNFVLFIKDICSNDGYYFLSLLSLSLCLHMWRQREGVAEGEPWLVGHTAPFLALALLSDANSWTFSTDQISLDFLLSSFWHVFQ